MADAVDLLSTLDLSSEEVKAMTNWPDEMVEDYLTIIRNLTDVAQIIDENAITLFDRLKNLEQVTSLQKRLVRSAMALANKNKTDLTSTKQELAVPDRTSKRNSKLINKTSEMIGQSLPMSGLLLNFEGVSLTNPTVKKGYNVDAAVRQGVGVYRVTMTQSSFYGVDIFLNSTICVYDGITPSANTSLFKVKVESVSTGVFDVKTYEVIKGGGTGVTLTPYEIDVGDIINVSFLFNNGEELPPE
ncbi:MAG: hypothetical protein K0U08_03365 [Proteobacteria bacterium]|nr:hypothetical protein [Pseudomonadota bacterium]